MRVVWHRHVPFLAVTIALTTAGCDDMLIAPSGSTIELSVTPTTIPAEGGNATVTVLLHESDGYWVEDGTEVSLIATNGAICPIHETNVGGVGDDACRPDGSSAATILTLRTKGGTVRARFASGGASGTATVRARSGSISTEVNIAVSSRTAPLGSELILLASPDSVSMGDSVKILALLTTPDNTPVADGTRVHFVSSAGAFRNQLALTNDGYVATHWRAPMHADTVIITGSSGATQSSTSVIVH